MTDACHYQLGELHSLGKCIVTVVLDVETK